jgi:hypothetical protein
MEIEQRLNEAGRGEPLLPNETARQASLHVLDDLLQSDDGMPTISCSVAFTS